MIFEHRPIELFEPLKSLDLPGGRVYVTSSGDRYPSVTTVLGATSDKSGLDAWRARVGDAEADRVSREATRRGTAVHEMAETYLNNDPFWSAGRASWDLDSFRDLARVLDRNVRTVYAQEAAVYSHRLRTAGRMDLFCQWNGVDSVVDFKTSRRRKQKSWITNYFVQGSFYAAAIMERTREPVKQIVIVIVVDDDEPQIFVENPLDWLPHFITARKAYDRLTSEQE